MVNPLKHWALMHGRVNGRHGTYRGYRLGGGARRQGIVRHVINLHIRRRDIRQIANAHIDVSAIYAQFVKARRR